MEIGASHDVEILPCVTHALNCLMESDPTKFDPSTDIGRKVDSQVTDSLIEFVLGENSIDVHRKQESSMSVQPCRPWSLLLPPVSFTQRNSYSSFASLIYKPPPSASHHSTYSYLSILRTLVLNKVIVLGKGRKVLLRRQGYQVPLFRTAQGNSQIAPTVSCRWIETQCLQIAACSFIVIL